MQRRTGYVGIATAASTFLLSLAVCICPSPASEPCSSPAGRPTALQLKSAADAVNRDGLAAFRTASLDNGPSFIVRYGHVDLAISPIAVETARAIAAIGADASSPSEAWSSVPALANVMNRSDFGSLSSRVWVDDHAIAPSNLDLDRLRTLSCSDVAFDDGASNRTSSPIEAPIDRAMRIWASTQSVWSAQSFPSLSFSLYGAFEDRVVADHAFGALAALSRHGTVERGAHSIAYMEQGSIAAVRVDSRDAGLSVYEFVGSDQDILSLRGSLDVHAWSKLRTNFVTRVVNVQSYAMDGVTGGWFDPGVSQGFGTDFSYGKEQALLTLSADRVDLDILSGLVGVYPARPEGDLPIRTFTPGKRPPSFSTLRSMLYVVEDTTTGVILLVGVHLSDTFFHS